MKYCRSCVEPDTRPGQVFNEEGLCTPCSLALSYDAAEWDRRRKELDEIVAWANERRSPLGYDSIIGVSGGKDSTRLAFFAREIGLNPLLVSFVYPPIQQTDLGAANLSNLVEQGFDVMTVNPAPEVYRRAIRHSFLKLGNWTNPSEIALYASLPRTALQTNIPLACAGENPFITLGSGAGGSKDGNAINVVSMNTLRGGDITPFLDEYNTEDKMYFFRFPEKDRILKNDLKLIYLGYYIEDYDQHNNAEFAVQHGMKLREGRHADPARTGFIHNHSMLDEDFVIVNQYLKYLKLGFGMTAQQASLDIRAGRLTRSEAIELCEKFDGQCHEEYIERFCDFLDIPLTRFWEVAESWRNPEIWKLQGNKWELKTKLRDAL
ncbi:MULTISPECIES: N-acetyl sugar amidotransferase [Thalassospira]|uniref:LPS biosynthesis protein n=1 Tax=Thalassospira profundimaris TaxID=502049 RepID=A0A367VJN3_9PROT|nr:MULTISPECIES: N-acetyl sugar amidotransferase [Thalassospira]KZB70918.1 hypothetical protein AUQ43_08700 [Thalassospira sp. MCCC 1A01148]MBR9899364.1 N-acetyl sugar amidotransferase [Rhodospirillales bacterium]RCK25438.1 hypothetical protein TH6_02155 [Thalassospira profundimaris]